MSLTRLTLLFALLASCTGGTEPAAERPTTPVGPDGPLSEEQVAEAEADRQFQQFGVRIRPVGPSGAIPESVVIRAVADVFPPELLGAVAPASTIVNITPKIEGTLEITGEDAITFRPTTSFLPNTVYDIDVAAIGVEGELKVPSEKGAWHKSFETPAFALLRMNLYERDPSTNKATVELVFSGPVDVDDVAAHAKFTLDGASVSPSLVGEGYKPNAVRFTFSGRDFFREVPLALELGAGVSLVGDPSVVAAADKTRVELAAGQPWKVLAVRVREGTSGFYLDVICNDEAAGHQRYWWDRESWDDYYVSERCMVEVESALHGMHFVPAVDFSVASGAAGYRIFGDFERGSYDLVIDAGTQTVDGAMLESSFETEFVVPERSPKIQFAAKGRYLPRNAWDSLEIRHVNVNGVEVIVRHVPEENLIFWMSGTEPASARTSSIVAKTEVALPLEPDSELSSWIDLGALVPDAGSGVYELSIRGLVPSEDVEDDDEDWEAAETRDTGWWPRSETTATTAAKTGPTDHSRLLLTDLQLVAKLAAPEPGSTVTPAVIAWALDTHTGKPVTGVDIRLVRPSGQTLGDCRTDFSGSCTVEVSTDELDQTPPMALVAKRGDDLTYLKFSDLQVAASGEVYGEPFRSEQPYRAALYLDRGVYRPGDTAHISAIIRTESHAAPEEGMPVVVKVFDPRGKELRKLVTQANPGGLLSVDVPFADFATTGQYRATVEIGELMVGSTDFNVEEFVPERMKVEVSADARGYLSDEVVPVDVMGRWLFGGSAEGSKVELTCQLAPGSFRPERNSSYHYGLSEVDDGTERRSTTLGSLSDTLDAEGRATVSCPAASRSGGFLGAARLIAQAAVFEGESGRTTLGEVSVPVHPEPFYLGLSTSLAKAEAGKDLPVKGVVVDWDGEVDPGAVAEVEIGLVRLEEEYVWSYDESEGRYHYRRLLRRVQEGSETLTLSRGEFATTLHPTGHAAGYLIFAAAGEARTELFIEGSGRRYWWMGSDASVDATPRPNKPGELRIDVPADVAVGDTVTVEVTAPYGGRMLLTAETHEVLEKKWKQVEAGPVQWTFTVSEFVPNVYVSALLLKDPHLETDEAYLPDRAFGVKPVRVRPVAYTQSLSLSVPDEVRPYSSLEIGIDTGPLDAPAYVTVAAVDEGILSLTDFESPDPLTQIFARRALGVSTYETVGWTLLVQPGGAGSTTGGDGESGGGGRVQMVKPVALWSGVVEVPVSGKATVAFDLPSYRGELRVMAVVASPRRMGSASESVTVKEPLVLQTTLPRFLVEGDTATIPVFVSNLSGSERDVVVRIETEDLESPDEKGLIAITETPRPAPVTVTGDATATLHLEDGSSDTVLFRVVATSAPDAARFIVTATSGSETSHEEIELPIMLAMPEVREVTRISLAAGINDLTPVMDGWLPGSDRTSVWVTTNPYAPALTHLRGVVRYPYGCIEQTTSSTRPLLYVKALLDVVDPTLAKDKPVDEMVRAGVERVLSMQTPSGGFAYWPGGYSPNPWGTAYGTHMLIDAKAAGYPVPQRAINDALRYMEKEADRRVGTSDADHTTAYIHYVLALAGKGRAAQAEKLLAHLEEGHEASASYYDLGEPRYLLMAAMYLGGDRRYESELRSPDTTPLTGKRRNDWTFWSDLRGRGFMLSVYYDLFGTDGRSGELLADIVGSGLAQQRTHYYTTQEMAWGLTGLGKWVSGGSHGLGDATLTASGHVIPSEGLSTKGGTESVWSLAGASEAVELSITLDKVPKSGAYAVVSTQGVPTDGLPVGAKGLRLTRELLAEDGSPLDRVHHTLGDVAYVRLTLANTSGSQVQNVAMVDRVPAGWEIENPRLNGGGMPDWADRYQLWGVEHMNLRDDRIELFGALGSGEDRQIIYQVRAVTAGTFTYPPATAEAMYDPAIWGRLPAETLVIRDPWGGS